MAIGLATQVSAIADDAVYQIEHPNRDFYGYFLSNASFSNGSGYGYGKTSFSDMSQSELMLPQSDGLGVFAAGAVDGVIYACQYSFISSLEGTRPMAMVAYNIYTGAFNEIGQWDPKNENTWKPTDMSYDYKNGKMYALVAESMVGGYLCEVNLETAEFTRLVPVEHGSVLAISPKGDFYTIDVLGGLYQIDPATGKCTLVMQTGLEYLSSMQTMEFDRTSGKLYWAAATRSYEIGETFMQEIDIEAKTIKNLGKFGSQTRFMGLFIPYASSFNAPAAPANVKLTPAEPTVLKATLTWENPTTTFGGEPLNGLNGIAIMRNGQEIHYFDSAEAGKAMSWTDENVPADGYYRYDVVATNGSGDGAKGTYFAYVGYDAPGKVGNPTCTVAPDYMSINLKWDAPATGAHQGGFEKDGITYKITRRPDNRVVAENLKTTTFNDSDLRRMLRYWYDIEAINEKGSSLTTTGSFIAGGTLEVPVQEEFIDMDDFHNKWTAVDYNGDAFTWSFNTTLGPQVFGDLESGAEYILSPTSADQFLEPSADEWLISPPVKFEAGKDYEFTFMIRTFVDEQIQIYYGHTNTPDGMLDDGELIENYEIKPDGKINETTGGIAFQTFHAALPAMTDGEIGCVALNLVTPVDIEMPLSYLQINKMFIDEAGKHGQLNNVVAEPEVSYSLTDRTLTVIGNFSGISVTTASGATVATSATAVTDLSALPAGMYVISVNTPAGTESFKVVLK